jgi:hypothetical protein
MTADEILNRLVAIFPAFKNEWESDENYFREDDGSFDATFSRPVN